MGNLKDTLHERFVSVHSSLIKHNCLGYQLILCAYIPEGEQSHTVINVQKVHSDLVQR